MGRDEQNLGKSAAHKYYFEHNFQQTQPNKGHQFNSSLPSHIFKWNVGKITVATNKLLACFILIELYDYV